MIEEASTTRQKALAINLDLVRYGTFPEIGGGQKVARWFFTLAARRRRRDCAVQGWIVTSVSNLTVNFSQLSVVIVYAIT